MPTPPTGRHRASTAQWPPPPGALAAAGWALLPLRAFLGVTFCFAGLQKLANPNFFDPNSPSGIQAQLIASERISPLHSVLGHLLHLATPVGVLIALGELAVGLGTLLGLWARLAAIGGLLLSLTLFLTVSFHASPYFTGADIVFVFAWAPLILAGAGGVWALDAVVVARARRLAEGDPDGPAADRRALVLGAAAVGATAVVALVAAGLAAGLGRLVGGTHPPAGGQTVTLPGAGSTSTPTTGASPSTTSSTTTGASPSTTSSTTPPEPTGTAIGAASAVPVGGSARFTDPASGDPGLVLQLTKGSFVAYDAVCPHAGCTVGYSTAGRLIVCPCHGSEFNPDTGAVEVGPATRGLRVIKVAEGADGRLYVDG
ncbi:MAG TPA: Rieske (2Fe-2S) protein [Acidimicrobiales bacterium]|jgi:thiosulfate dehydrogenase [quinone] large subunit|nr:Rieske (2Fe-2S) protein [Acidimicrobiales bacterium]